jgi:hypothetical protein
LSTTNDQKPEEKEKNMKKKFENKFDFKNLEDLAETTTEPTENEQQEAMPNPVMPPLFRGNYEVKILVAELDKIEVEEVEADAWKENKHFIDFFKVFETGIKQEALAVFSVAKHRVISVTRK